MFVEYQVVVVHNILPFGSLIKSLRSVMELREKKRRAPLTEEALFRVHFMQLDFYLKSNKKDAFL